MGLEGDFLTQNGSEFSWCILMFSLFSFKMGLNFGQMGLLGLEGASPKWQKKAFGLNAKINKYFPAHPKTYIMGENL